MDEISIVSAGYKELLGTSEFFIYAIPRSGSDRKYLRITTES
jgi:hypothetical protein